MSKIPKESKAELMMYSMIYDFMSRIKRDKEKGTTFKIHMRDDEVLEVKDVKAISNNNIFTDFMKLLNNKHVLTMRVHNKDYIYFKAEDKVND